MIPFQLPTGKTIFINDIFLLTDEDIQNFIADDIGIEINNPFSELKNEVSLNEWDIPEIE